MVATQSTLEARTAGRLARLQARLRESEAAALLLYANGYALGTRARGHGYLQWLTGIRNAAAPTVLLLARSGAAALLTTDRFLPPWRPESADTPALHVSENLPRDVQEWLARHAPAPAPLALADAGELPLRLWQAIDASAQRRWVDAHAWIDAERGVRSPAELAAHRAAAAICDSLFDKVPVLVAGRSTRPGRDLQADLLHAAARSGSDHATVWLAYGRHPERLRYQSAEAVEPIGPGPLLIGLMLTADGAWGHALRTFHVGTPSDHALATFARVRATHEAAIAAVRPGALLQTLENDAAGRLQPEVTPPTGGTQGFRVFHGLGDAYDEPLHGGTADAIVLRENMVLEVHPNAFSASGACAALGDMVRVGHAGAERLTQQPLDMVVLPPG